MFELIEAVSGRLIGLKSWNRIVIIFEAQIVQSMTVHSWFGLLDCVVSNKSCVGCMRPKIAVKFGFTK